MTHSKPTVNDRLTSALIQFQKALAAVSNNEALTRARVDSLEGMVKKLCEQAGILVEPAEPIHSQPISTEEVLAMRKEAEAVTEMNGHG